MRSMNWTSINLVGVLLSLLVVSCSPSPPAALSEEELLEGLAGMKHGPFQFKDKTWPLLVNKTVTYCGTIAEAEGTDADSSVTLNVEKTHAGETLDWSLQGKSDSLELAREYKVGDAICMTGIFEGYVIVPYYKPSYRGTMKLTSWEKPTAS